MVVKTKEGSSHIEDLKEIFNQLRKYHMKLNPSKWAFGVSRGKLLSFVRTHKGIVANPEKCKAIVEMQAPKRIKEVQSLDRRIATDQPKSEQVIWPSFGMFITIIN